MKKIEKEYLDDYYPKRLVYFLLSAFLLLFFGFLILAYLFHSSINISEASLVISTSELTKEESEIFYDILNSIDDNYLFGQKSIFVVKNLTKYYNKEANFFSNYDPEYLLGFNKKGRIYVLYNKDREGLKETLCHELLHTYFVNTEETHIIIEKLGRKGICY